MKYGPDMNKGRQYMIFQSALIMIKKTHRKLNFAVILILLHIYLVYKLQRELKIDSQLQTSAGRTDFDHQIIKISHQYRYTYAKVSTDVKYMY